MSLQAKILSLKLEGAAAMRHAMWWEKMLREHGEEKATAFYKHLGLNHLEQKSIEWEGLKLSREPTPAEKLAVKGVHQTQETSKEQITRILLDFRVELLDEGVSRIEKLDPADYAKLVLEASPQQTRILRDKLDDVYLRGRQLVATELGRKDALPDHDDEELDTLTDVTNARVVNDVQSRITAAAARFRALGLTGAALNEAIINEVVGGSVSYIDRASTGAANRTISMGRSYEAERRIDDWGRVEYSAILDNNVCGPCAAEDGKTAASEDDLQPTPNPECEGGDWCRCFLVYINQ